MEKQDQAVAEARAEAFWHSSAKLADFLLIRIEGFPMKLRIFVLAAFLAGGLSGQRADMKGTFSGKVMAPDGSAVASAAVTVSDAAGHVRTAKSGPDGLFNVNDLPEGTYRVEIAVPGYRKLTQTDVQVTDGSPLNIKFALKKEPRPGWRRLFSGKSASTAKFL